MCALQVVGAATDGRDSFLDIVGAYAEPDSHDDQGWRYTLVSRNQAQMTLGIDKPDGRTTIWYTGAIEMRTDIVGVEGTMKRMRTMMMDIG
jgi:hypothetical protein